MSEQLTKDSLLPCPHCGREDTPVVEARDVYHDEGCDCHDTSGYFAVFCDASHGKGGCGASGGFQPGEAEAIALWNRRVSA